MIVFSSVSFAYPEKSVLHDFSMHVLPGEQVRLTGASGAGKTTVLKLILGLKRPQSGEIRVNAGRVSVLFQEDRLLPFYTVAGNLDLFCDPARARELLDELGIASAADQYPSQLSGGIARRAALARALTLDADLYLFDEPFTGLDAESRKTCLSVLRRRLADRTAVFVSHLAEDAEELPLREIPVR